MMKKIVIIGAGPAGLAAAVCLARNGHDVTVLEGDSEVGGMSKSFSAWGHVVDLGPHRFFSSDPRVNRFWLDAVDGAYHMVSRLTRIYYQGKYYNYPLDLKNVLSNLGLLRSFRVALSYLFRPKTHSGEDNFENWTVSRFGTELYLMFFKTYSERLWGMPCSELDADFARQRIRKLSLFEVVKAAIIGNQSKHKTLVDSFAYPTNGSGSVYKNLETEISALGGKVMCRTYVEGLSLVDGQVKQVIADGLAFDCDYVISTMPVTKLVKLLDADDGVMDAVRNLKYRNTLLIYLLIDQTNLFTDQWIYIHDPNVQCGRITNFSNWAINTTMTSTVLCLEYWSNDDEVLWQQSDESLIRIAKDDVNKAFGIVAELVNDGFVKRISKSYPVYRFGYSKHVSIIKDYLIRFENVLPIGRYGSFKYNNQDHSILMGLLAADKICGKTDIDLWLVNSDDEYQESSKITENGLILNEG
jgi:protoporphyrinogen oxidase